LDIPRPDFNLEIAGGSHGQMTGRMLEAIEQVLLAQKPDWVLVYGDTNSTLAGALAAAKLHIPVAHVEAGLRSFNMRMPEEVNRILTDNVSTLLFCPTETAVRNLEKEGIKKGVHQVGDVMLDVAMYYGDLASQSTTVADLELAPKKYALATCHRPENTDDPRNLEQILSALSQIANSIMPIVLPLHPRTRIKINEFGLGRFLTALIIKDPLPFIDMIALQKNAAVVLTDSGGLQKEAFFYGVPCVTIRKQTEWIETIEAGLNTLARADCNTIVESFAAHLQEKKTNANKNIFGNGKAAKLILDNIVTYK